MSPGTGIGEPGFTAPGSRLPDPDYDREVSLRQNIRDFFHGAAYGAYERELRLQAAELNDLFLLLCYMEIVGLPNPATLYLLDTYPYLLEQFHQWHRRMGMDRSPLGTLPCC